MWEYQEQLAAENDIAIDPTTNTYFHAPTDPKKVKLDLHNVGHCFERPPFPSSIDVPSYDNFLQKILNKHTKKKETICMNTDMGVPR